MFGERYEDECEFCLLLWWPSGAGNNSCAREERRELDNEFMAVLLDQSKEIDELRDDPPRE